ncbi:MAG: glycosyltransferase [Halobacteriales archaeon]
MSSASPSPPGAYRRRESVRLVDDVLVSTAPLAASRLNEAAVDVVRALGAEYRPAEAIARETAREPASVIDLLEDLRRRGFLAWRPERDPSHTPPVSVVVTVRNDREPLRECLDALGRLDYPSSEVVVIDDGSTDGTAAMASNHPLAEAGRLRTVAVGSASEPLGIGASRNRGVEAAAHDVIAFTDADCRPDERWLADLVPFLARHDVVGGRVRPAGDSTASAYEEVNASLDMGPEPARVHRGGDVPYLPTANLVGRRAAFEAVRFPPRNVAEDVAFCWRALEAGYDVVYTPTGVVGHRYRTGLGAVAARRATYGASEALLAAEFGRDRAGRVAVPTSAAIVAALGLVWLATSGALATVAAALGAGVVGLAAVGRVRRLWQLHARLAPAVSRADIARSQARSWLSAAYALAREVTRYYAAPLTLLGGVIGLAGWPSVAGVVLVAVVAAVALPLVIEYAVHDPATTVAGYAAYYLADHGGYQLGVYRGAVRHRTLAHLAPGRRFRMVGPGTGALATLGHGDRTPRRGGADAPDGDDDGD